MSGQAAEPTPLPAGDVLWGFLPKPIAVVLAVALAIAYVVSEISGKLNGPLSRLLAHREQRRQDRSSGEKDRDRRVEELVAAMATMRAERDRRVEELQESFKIQGERLTAVLEQVESQRNELRMVHRLSDAQARAIRRHLDWDRRWIGMARDQGLDIPDPPPSLYVDDNDEDGVT